MKTAVVLAACFMALATAQSQPETLQDISIFSEPEVQCNSDSIDVAFNTKKPFEGHLYVKNYFHDLKCRTSPTNKHRYNVSLVIPFNECGVQRQKSYNPAGVKLLVTILAMRHPKFQTKGDMAWHLSCLYAATETSVSSLMEVSDLPTESLTHEIAAPSCSYGIYSSPDGNERVRFAVVGQKVYHRWQCETDAEDVYCVKVHSCVVKGRSNSTVTVVEENGCVKDTHLMSPITYPGHLTAISESSVFKFADDTTIDFNCKILLSLSGGQPCPSTLENCSGSRRRRNVLPNNVVLGTSENGADIDVYSNSLVILDVEESPASAAEFKQLQNLAFNTSRRVQSFEFNDQRVCLTTISFGILVAMIGVLLITSTMATVLVCCRRRPAKQLA